MSDIQDTAAIAADQPITQHSDNANGEGVNVLVEFFNGPSVAHHSIGLQVGGVQEETAMRFFKARTALGIKGYQSEEEAREAILFALFAKS